MSHIEDAECLYPDTLPEALSLLSDPVTRGELVAGCSDLMVQWSSGRPIPIRAISVLAIPELKAIEQVGDVIHIGAGVTYTELRRSSAVCAGLPALVSAASEVGGIQIQTMGTLGGSMANASPAGDPAPPLLITDGTVVTASVDGERRIPLTEFWTGYKTIELQDNELILRIECPILPSGWKDGWKKLGPRGAQAISKVMGSWRGCVSEGKVEAFRVALGSVGPTSIRLSAVEEAVTGQPLNDALIAKAEKVASDSVTPIDDIRSTATYRKWVTGRLVRGFLEQLVP